MPTSSGPSSTTGQISGERLRVIRHSLDLSQAEFAALIRQAGTELGEPNACTKRLVQKWEAGQHGTCRPNYRRALTKVTGLTYAQLCEPQLMPQNGVSSPLVALDQVIQQLGELRERLMG
jgi:transcriptional regulator with XRE-family HTH domain